MADIKFQEGSYHLVEITIADDINLEGMKASIKVRKFSSFEEMFNFENLPIVGQKIILEIPSSLSIGKSGAHQWQLKLYTNDSDAVELSVGNFIVEKSVNI